MHKTAYISRGESRVSGPKMAFARVGLAASFALGLLLRLPDLHAVLAGDLGSVKFIRGDYAVAEQLLQSALRSPSPSGAFLRIFANALWSEGRRSEAISVLRVSTLKDDVGSNASELALFDLGRMLIDEGRVAEGARAWGQAKAWRRLLYAGQLSANDAAWENAIAYLDEAWRLDEASAAYDLAWAFYYGRADPDSAAEILLRSIAAYPSSNRRADYLISLGFFLTESQEWAKAVSVYEELLSEGASNPQVSARAHVGLGVALAGEGTSLPEALREIAEGIALAPDAVEGYMAMADVLREQQMYDDADSWYAKAMDVAGDNPRPGIARGEAQIEAGNLSTAIEILHGTTSRFPGSGDAWYILAVAYSRLHAFEDATRAIDRALSLEGDNGMYWLLAGSISEGKGDRVAAIAAYKQVIIIDPNSRTAGDALARLQR